MIRVGREICGYFKRSIHREWLVTNGIGGYAMGTLCGANSRRYHGLLVAALNPPVERTVFVAQLQEQALLGDREFALSTSEFHGRYIHPHGYLNLESFRLEGSMPTFTYALAEARLEKRIWMAHGHNTTYVLYTLLRGARPLKLTVLPLCTARNHHQHAAGAGWQARLAVLPQGLSVQFADKPPYFILSREFSAAIEGEWYWRFAHRVETYRGLDDQEDLYAMGRFSVTLAPGQTAALVISTENDPDLDGLAALEAERQRQRRLLAVGPLARESEPAFIHQLLLAADQFIVSRGEGGQSIIAGYPWFTDWGRDTMIALPGLTLATGRPEVAARILRTYARYVDQGMIPNRFPDEGQTPEYNTVDATLWYFQAIHEYVQRTGDGSLVDDLYPVLASIIDWHERGTRYGIGVDARDGLLRAGQPGVQLTWMDAKVDDWVVTPRIGKPVEINALWYNALRIMADFASRMGDGTAADRYQTLTARVAVGIGQRFWYADGGYLYDVIDGPVGHDASLRPNQIFAVSLPHSALSIQQARAVVQVVGRALLTSHGLRSLAVDHPDYVAHYGGDRWHRDGAYHQGTVWGWLIGAYAVACHRVTGDAAAARGLLEPFADHLLDSGMGTISEIFDGDPPHTPRGCPAQAWSVAEVLRAWLAVRESESDETKGR
ncbi:MAG: amylo-alpha-1,6-glucosidase [Chloroflexota bacterium]